MMHNFRPETDTRLNGLFSLTSWHQKGYRIFRTTSRT